MEADHKHSPSPEPIPERIPFLELGDNPLPLEAIIPVEPVHLPSEAPRPPSEPERPQRPREVWALLPRPLPRGPLVLLFVSLSLLLLLLPQAFLILRVIVAEVLIYLRVLMVPLLAIGIVIYLLRIFYPRRS